MKKELESKLKQMLVEWSSQDNRATRFPYYVTIRDCRTKYELSNQGDFVYDDDNDEIVNILDKIKQLSADGELTEDDYAVLNIDGPEEIDDLEVDCFTRQDFFDVLENFGITDERTFEEVEEWYDEGIFFTVKDAEEYLENCKNHHTSKAHTYIDCFTSWGRTSQTEQFLIDLFNYFEVPVPPELYHQNNK